MLPKVDFTNRYSKTTEMRKLRNVTVKSIFLLLAAHNLTTHYTHYSNTGIVAARLSGSEECVLDQVYPAILASVRSSRRRTSLIFNSTSTVSRVLNVRVICERVVHVREIIYVTTGDPISGVHAAEQCREESVTVSSHNGWPS